MTTITWKNKQGTHTKTFTHSVARVFMMKLRTFGADIIKIVEA